MSRRFKCDPDDELNGAPRGAGRQNRNPNDPDYDDQAGGGNSSPPGEYYRTTKGYDDERTKGGAYDSDSESSWSSGDGGTRNYEAEANDQLSPLPPMEDEDDRPSHHHQKSQLIQGSSINEENLNSVRVIRFGPTSDKLGIQFGLKTSRFTGPLVTIASVERDSQADLRGIQNDWVLTHLDGEPINVKTSEEFSKFINTVARKRNTGLTLSFNTQLLKRLKKRMSVQYLDRARSAREDGLAKRRLEESAKYKLDQALREAETFHGAEERAAAIEHLRLAIENAKRQDVDYDEAEQTMRRLQVIHEFDKLKDWDNPSWKKSMTPHEVELTDLEQRIAGLEATVKRAAEMSIDTRSAREVVWKLKGLYKCSEKLPPMSRDTRMRILKIQEIALELHAADQMTDENMRRARRRELKDKITHEIREASGQQRPSVLKELIATAKLAQLEVAYWQEILDVINGVCDHCCQQHIKAMRTIAKDCDELNVDAQGIKEFADWLVTQRVRLKIRITDENTEREARNRTPKRRRNSFGFGRRSKRSREDEDDEKTRSHIFDMYKFHSVKDLKMEAFKKLGLSIFAQDFYKDNKKLDADETLLSEIFREDELLDRDRRPRTVELKLFVKEWETTKWVNRTVLEDLKTTAMHEAREMEKAKDMLVVAVEDRDFHNFLRYSSMLRKHWCKMEISRRHRNNLKDQLDELERYEERQNNKRRQSANYGGYAPSRRAYYDEEDDGYVTRGYRSTPQGGDYSPPPAHYNRYHETRGGPRSTRR